MLYIITGMTAAGKSELGKWMSDNYNMGLVEVSDLVKKILKKHNSQYASGAVLINSKRLSQLLIATVKQLITKQKNVVVIGIRETRLISSLKEVDKTIVITIKEEPESVRWQRTQDKYTASEFARKSVEEKWEMDLPKIIRSADYTLQNSRDYQRVSEIITETSRARPKGI